MNNVKGHSSFGTENFDPSRQFGSSGGNGGNLEARVAKLESDVEYIKRDIGEIKASLKDIKADVTKSFDKVDDASKSLDKKMDNILITLSEFETRLVKWVIGLVVTVATISFAIARFIS